MARMLQILLHIHHVRRKRRFGFCPRHRIGFGDFIIVKRGFHSLAAAAVFGFDNYRIADFVRPFFGVLNAFQRRRPRSNRQPCLNRGFARGNFIAQKAHLFGGRPDKRNAVLFHHLCKIGIFGQETVTGVNGVRAGNQRRRDNRRFVQIRVGRTCRPDADGFVRQPDMHGIGIGFRMHRHRPDAHFAAGSVDSERNFAAVGN